MIDWLANTIMVASLLLAGWSLVSAFLGRPMNIAHLIGIGALEVLLIAQVAVSTVLLVGGERPEQLAVFLSYLVTVVLVPPLCALWGLTERSKWGPGVIAFACLVLPALIVRLQQIWDPSLA